MEKQVVLEVNKSYMFEGHGVGEVKKVYVDNLRGKEEDFVEIFFPNINMKYSSPIERLHFRELESIADIKKVLKKNMKKEVENILSLDMKSQQAKINELIQSSEVNGLLLAYKTLDAKKYNASLGTLTTTDNKLYKKLLHMLSDELSISSGEDKDSCEKKIREYAKKQRFKVEK